MTHIQEERTRGIPMSGPSRSITLGGLMNTAAVVLLFLSQATFAWADDFLTVAVRDSKTGAPVKWAVVQLHYQGIWVSGYTYWEGEAWFTGIRDNDSFEVAVDAPGYKQVVQKAAIFSRIAPILNVHLEKDSGGQLRTTPPPSLTKRLRDQRFWQIFYPTPHKLCDSNGNW